MYMCVFVKYVREVQQVLVFMLLIPLRNILPLSPRCPCPIVSLPVFLVLLIPTTIQPYPSTINLSVKGCSATVTATLFHGCVGVWVYWYMGVWVYRFVGVWVYVCISI